MTKKQHVRIIKGMRSGMRDFTVGYTVVQLAAGTILTHEAMREPMDDVALMFRQPILSRSQLPIEHYVRAPGFPSTQVGMLGDDNRAPLPEPDYDDDGVSSLSSRINSISTSTSS